MGRSRRQKSRRNQRKNWVDAAEELNRTIGDPCCAVIKTGFLRDLFTNVMMVLEMDSDATDTPAECVTKVFQGLRTDGYLIKRDGDTIVIQDIDGQITLDKDSVEMEGAICESADVVADAQGRFAGMEG